MSARKRQDHHRTHVTAPTPNANALIPLVFLIMVVPLKKLPPSPVFVWYVPSVCFNAKPWRRVSDWAPKFIVSKPYFRVVINFTHQGFLYGV